MDSSKNSKNEKLITDTWGKEKLQRAKRPGEETSKGWIVRHVPVERIERFLVQFITHKTLKWKKEGVIEYLRAKSDLYRTCDVVLVSIGEEEKTKPLRLGVQKRASKDEIKGDRWGIRKHRVASRGDEGLGLSKKQVLEAQKRAKSRPPSDMHYRAVRKHPLLMIHVLTGDAGSTLENARIPTIGMSFPPDDYTTEVEVVANPAYVLAVHGEKESDWEIGED